MFVDRLPDVDAPCQLEPEDADPGPRDVSSDVTWIVTFRQGFHDGADSRAPSRTAWAYERGYRNGCQFRDMVSGTRQWPCEPHFPGWPFDPRLLPLTLRYWHKGLWAGGWRPIVITPGKHGGDRKSAAFRASAAPPPAL